jgi:hypothetical protein
MSIIGAVDIIRTKVNDRERLTETWDVSKGKEKAEINLILL